MKDLLVTKSLVHDKRDAVPERTHSCPLFLDSTVCLGDAGKISIFGSFFFLLYFVSFPLFSSGLNYQCLAKPNVLPFTFLPRSILHGSFTHLLDLYSIDIHLFYNRIPAKTDYMSTWKWKGYVRNSERAVKGFKIRRGI
jgi:hypothetical protein